MAYQGTERYGQAQKNVPCLFYATVLINDEESAPQLNPATEALVDALTTMGESDWEPGDRSP